MRFFFAQESTSHISTPGRSSLHYYKLTCFRNLRKRRKACQSTVAATFFVATYYLFPFILLSFHLFFPLYLFPSLPSPLGWDCLSVFARQLELAHCLSQVVFSLLVIGSLLISVFLLVRFSQFSLFLPRVVRATLVPTGIAPPIAL